MPVEFTPSNPSQFVSVSEDFARNSLNQVVGVFQNREGYAKPNRYEVEIYFPNMVNLQIGKSATEEALDTITNLITADTFDGQRKMSLRCNQVSFPGKTLRSVPTTEMDYGPEREVAMGAIFGEVSLSFYATSDMREHMLLNKWQEHIFNTKREIGSINSDPHVYDVEYYQNYVGQIDVYQLNELNERTYAVSIHECYPKGLNAIEFGHGNMNEISKVSASFVFNRWSSDRRDINYIDTLFETGKNIVGSAVTNIGRNLPRTLNL